MRVQSLVSTPDSLHTLREDSSVVSLLIIVDAYSCLDYCVHAVAC